MARSIHRLGLQSAFANVIGTSRPRVIATTNKSANICCRYNCLAGLSGSLNIMSTRYGTYHERIVRCIPASATAAVPYPSLLRFDKVPDKLPDWWDDEDEDEDEEDSDGNKGGDERDEGNREGGSGSGSGGDEGPRGGGGGGGSGDGGGRRAGVFAMLLAMYVRSIKTNPVRTKAISTSLLAFMGDLLAQKIAQRDKAEFVLDMRRSASVGLWGFCMMGPVLHYWYGILDRLFFGKFAVMNKLLSDQLLFAPLFNGAFMLGVGSLEGHPFQDLTETVRTKLWPSMKANWTLWPAAQVVNFALVPKTFQIVYVNCVALVWSVVLAYIAHDE